MCPSLLSSFQDKILLGGGRDSIVTVTNDGATILKSIGIDNPAAQVLVGKIHFIGFNANPF